MFTFWSTLTRTQFIQITPLAAPRHAGCFTTGEVWTEQEQGIPGRTYVGICMILRVNWMFNPPKRVDVPIRTISNTTFVFFNETKV